MAESAFNIGDIQGQIKGLSDQIGTVPSGKTLQGQISAITTPHIYRGAEVCTAKNSATLDTTNSYTRASKLAGIATVEIRITCPTITNDNTLIAVLNSALIPYADVTYIKAYDMWGTSLVGIVTLRSSSGNIEAMPNCSGKNIQIIVTYPCSTI